MFTRENDNILHIQINYKNIMWIFLPQKNHIWGGVGWLILTLALPINIQKHWTIFYESIVQYQV